MNIDKMVFFNIAWMKYYKGITDDDKPIHGGKYIKDNGEGAEVFNFLPHDGRIYGFVEPGAKKRCRINIDKLGARRWDKSISDVVVVWVARHEHKPQTVVVGWYTNATVHRERQEPPTKRKRPSGKGAPYHAEADERDCYLVPPDRRRFQVPRGKYGLGQKNIWYAEKPEGVEIKRKVWDYISQTTGNRC